jgi:ureidoacrylate peracid hydrolase
MEPYVTRETLERKTAEWLEAIEATNTHRMRLERDRCALLVIDMQKFFLDPQSPTFTCGGLAVLPTVKELIGAFRAARRPVIYTCHVHHPDRLDAGIMGWWWKGMCIEGSEASKVHEEIAPLPAEKIILKHRYSAFYNTDLETVLRCLHVEDLVVSGVMTNLCCESTARDAYFRDYRLFFLADGTGSVSEDMHVASLRNLSFGFAHVTRARDVIRVLRGEQDGEGLSWA